MTLNRRAFLPIAACGICAAALDPRRPTGVSGAHAASAAFDGCFISPQAYRQFSSDAPRFSSIADGLFARNRHFRSTGDPALDKDLDRALAVVADLFQVNPAFGFYDPKKITWENKDPETIVMNAWASAESTDIKGTWGTVGFGIDLFHKEFFEHDSSGSTIIAIVAHEFAHTWQQKSGNIDALRVGFPRKSEINADFLTGYFLGTRKRLNPARRFQKTGDLFTRIGASASDPARTHGSPKERLDAAEAGFRVAYVERGDLNRALKAGLEYVGL